MIVCNAVGAYLLYITWADRQVFGSPFKVTVLPASVTETSGGGSAASLSRGPGSIDMVDTSRVVQTTQTMQSRSAATAGLSNVISMLAGACVCVCVDVTKSKLTHSLLRLTS